MEYPEPRSCLNREVMFSEKVFGNLCEKEATGPIRLYVSVWRPNMKEHNVELSWHTIHRKLLDFNTALFNILKGK